jgi:phosphoribosylformimino-5-aminoimidazole carboxamide ribotide isomerase
MNVIPVIDLLNGVVVRGIAGQRDRYRRIHSTLAGSADPSVILNALQNTFGFRQFYVADLDAIQFQHLNRCTIAELARDDVSLIVDRGVRSATDVSELLELGVDRVVIALETLSGLPMAAELIKEFGAERLVLSLDLKHGNLLTVCDDWQQTTALNVARQLSTAGYQQIIVLDLAAVGTAAGNQTTALCRQLKQELPEVSLSTGGGIRDLNDLQELQRIGVDSALVASALHDGRLSAAEVASIRS